jgi:hypothetical protein
MDTRQPMKEDDRQEEDDQPKLGVPTIHVIHVSLGVGVSQVPPIALVEPVPEEARTEGPSDRSREMASDETRNDLGPARGAFLTACVSSRDDVSSARK